MDAGWTGALNKGEKNTMDNTPYEPLTSEQREQVIADAYTAPDHDEIFRIMIAVQQVLHVFGSDGLCDTCKESDGPEALAELECAVDDCQTFAAMRCLDFDDFMTSPKELESLTELGEDK